MKTSWAIETAPPGKARESYLRPGRVFPPLPPGEGGVRGELTLGSPSAMPRTSRRPADPLADLVIAWKTSARTTEYLLERIDESAWRAETPGEKGRTIAGIVAHVHNVRRMYLVGAGAKGIPPKMD